MDVLIAAPPAPSVRQLADAVFRSEFEDMVLPLRNDFVDTNADWKSRIRSVRALYRGDWEMAFPDGTVRADLPKTANPVQTGLDDLARLSTENTARHECEPDGASAADISNANLREHVLDTYWFRNEGEDMAPQLCYDLAGAGGCFVSVTARDGFDYPVFTRLDPDNCYPDVVNGILVTFLHLQRMKARHAKALYGVDYTSGAYSSEEVEIVDYYDSAIHLRGVIATGLHGGAVSGSAQVISRTRHDLGCVPIGWSKLKTLDGAWRGIFDQSGGGMLARNRILQLTLDYADQLVYSPLFTHDVENDTDPPSPRTIYRGRTPEARMMRIGPAGPNPELFQLMEYLGREGDRGTMQPAARAGEVSQSIASAAFVTSTLGQLTSLIRVLQREMANARFRMNYAAMKLEERFLDFNKVLVLNVGARDTYTPTKAIAGRYEHRIQFGSGAGLDALNKKVAILQDLGARLVSRDTARSELDYIGDEQTEAIKVDRELLTDALTQRLATEQDVSVLMNMVRLMLLGKDFAEASGIMAPMVEQNQMAQLAQQMGAGGAGAPPALPPGAPPGAPPAGGPGGPPPSGGPSGLPPGQAPEALSRGGQPTQPVQFPIPLQEQVMVRPPTGQ